MAFELASVIALKLEELSDDQVRALSNAVILYGRIRPGNLAYEVCVKEQIVRDNGDLWDTDATKAACALEVEKRFGKGGIQWPKR